jgi:hypothetical protein
MECTPGTWAACCVVLWLSALSLVLMLAADVFPVVIPMGCFPSLYLAFTAVTHLLMVLALWKVVGLPCSLADFHTTVRCWAAWVAVVVAVAWNPAGWPQGTMFWVDIAVDATQWLTTSAAFLYDMVHFLWPPDAARATSRAYQRIAWTS